ncbi:Formamidopyrimidine-DNA glycosylase N-terminal domain-containing protein [Russula earlei]|uniref:Formamidopyrimidine-DNA glycosylase N-terminal domain-containing protein n=1 Tax=Russula earlei TaxID=71964 RepID=A0ACC0UQP9_9AGAM|nr:Formamidopyrimidine-DNA glycosylase N-terminal domain-containing protein [Russula earlei]
MPELPEVERAAALLRSIGLDKQIKQVETADDGIVYAGVTNEVFADEVTGRTIKAVGRYGKVFYIELDGEGRHPVLHFGMTGMLQVKGNIPVHYREAPRKVSTDWPPRFMKFILHLGPASGDGEEVAEVAFLDARRLGRIRLCQSPLAEPPICKMGFDPILSMPDLADFSRGVLKRTCPIKALLLDQSFSAGVGNWVADEVLYHARIHPEQRCNSLSEGQVLALHLQIRHVCTFAVEVNADSSKFPDDWLFKHRWGKGKRAKEGDDPTLNLPDGRPATIKWVTVGGRTSAYVAELQHHGRERTTQKPRKSADAGESPSSPASEALPTTRKRIKKETSTTRKRRRW